MGCEVRPMPCISAVCYGHFQWKTCPTFRLICLAVKVSPRLKEVAKNREREIGLASFGGSESSRHARHMPRLTNAFHSLSRRSITAWLDFSERGRWYSGSSFIASQRWRLRWLILYFSGVCGSLRQRSIGMSPLLVIHAFAALRRCNKSEFFISAPLASLSIISIGSNESPRACAFGKLVMAIDGDEVVCCKVVTYLQRVD